MKFMVSLLLVCCGSVESLHADTTEAADASALYWRSGDLQTIDANSTVPSPYQDDDWYRSDFEIQRNWIGTAWRAENAVFAQDGLTLHLAPVADDSTQKSFLGAEVQSNDVHGFGRYEVVMRPSPAHGVISSFFTYTGPHFDDPHDEIDIEFLGRDTTRMWVLAYSDGKKLPGKWLELGFDAADAPHLYAFDWTADRIVWFVDGKEVFRVNSQNPPAPHHAGKIYMNIWAGGPSQRNWSGEAPADTQAEAQYYCVSYQPSGVKTPQCSDTFSIE